MAQEASDSTAATGAAHSGPFVVSTTTPWEFVSDGVRRQILGWGPDLMMVRAEFAPGAVGAIHRHPHRQVTYVAAGRFRVTLGEETRELGPGDCFFVLADEPHGVVALQAGTLIDTFTPVREDFLRATP